MFNQFFIMCSGADKNLLTNCSEGEKTKYVRSEERRVGKEC